MAIILSPEQKIPFSMVNMLSEWVGKWRHWYLCPECNKGLSMRK
jgi:hypothetical protein